MLTRLRADILFILIGAIPIIIAYLLKDTLTRDLCKDFGVVIVSLALVDLLWLLVAGGEPLSREIEELRNLAGCGKTEARLTVQSKVSRFS
jgi:hypothetical protein